jgi:hypothetical protein
VLLRATERGVALKRGVDARADQIADAVAADIDAQVVRDAAAALRAIRKQLETSLRVANWRS